MCLVQGVADYWSVLYRVTIDSDWTYLFFFVLVKISISVTKTQGPKITWEEWVYVTLQLITHHPGNSGQELKIGTWMLNLVQKLWKVGAYGPAHHDLLSLISYTTQDHLPKHHFQCSGLSTLIAIQENVLSLRLWTDIMWAFSQLRKWLEFVLSWHNVNSAMLSEVRMGFL